MNKLECFFIVSLSSLLLFLWVRQQLKGLILRPGTEHSSFYVHSINDKEKSLIELTRNDYVLKFSSSSLTAWHNNQECLSLANLSGLVLYFWERPGDCPRGIHFSRLSLACKWKTTPESLSRDKHSSLFVQIVIDAERSFNKSDIGCQLY
jgi:hypothetical protein